MKKFSLLFAFTLLTIIFFFLKNSVKADANHVVISEIQVAGGGLTPSADDEFIELYNPTPDAVDISSWSIQKETTGGAFTRKNFVSPAVIPAYGYYLIANNSYDNAANVNPDLWHNSFNLATTGTTVFLVRDQTPLTTGEEESIVDRVGIGTNALDAEGTPFTPIPPNDQSIERKPGAGDPAGGNGIDTDNNAADFEIRAISEPQNSHSAIEQPLSTTSPTVTPTETPTPVETATPSPTESPTETPSPTPTETPTQSPSPSPTPESTPTETPFASPEPTPKAGTPSPTPTLEPTLSPTPTPTASPSFHPYGWFRSPVFTCQNTHVPTWVYTLLKFLMPWKFHCK